MSCATLSSLFQNICDRHYVKSVRIRSCSGPHFSRIRPEYGEIQSISEYGHFMERYKVSLCIQFECGKMREK